MFPSGNSTDSTNHGEDDHEKHLAEGLAVGIGKGNMVMFLMFLKQLQEDSPWCYKSLTFHWTKGTYTGWLWGYITAYGGYDLLIPHGYTHKDHRWHLEVEESISFSHETQRVSTTRCSLSG